MPPIRGGIDAVRRDHRHRVTVLRLRSACPIIQALMHRYGGAGRAARVSDGLDLGEIACAAPPVPPVTGCTRRPAFESRTPPAADVTTPQASRHPPGRTAATIGRTPLQDRMDIPAPPTQDCAQAPRHAIRCPCRHGHAHLAHSHNLPRRGRVMTQIRQPRRRMPCPVDRARRCAGQSLPHANQSPTSGRIDRMAAPRTREWMICAASPARAAQLSAARNRRSERFGYSQANLVSHAP